MERIIIHSDMNSCYASIECSLNPSLKGKPVAVGGREEDRHGIILAKSDEAKKRGVKTGEPIRKAQIKCPDLIVVEPHYEIYREYSCRAAEIYYDYAERIEPMGLDEVWCDLTGYAKNYQQAKNMADEIRKRFREELGITVSVGISFNKIFAKLCSDLAQRDETYIVTPADFKEKLWSLPVGSMMGVGSKTAAKLERCAIRTIGDLALFPEKLLRDMFGVSGSVMYRNANGMDNSPVIRYGELPQIKSVGHGITCREDLTDNEQVWRVFLSLSQNIAERLSKEKLIARSVQISIRDNVFITGQFQCELPIATRSALEISRVSFELFKKSFSWHRNVRALTLRAINLQDEATPLQLDLYNDYKKHDRQMKIEDTVLLLRKKYGDKAVVNCCLMLEDKMPQGSEKKPIPFRKYY